MLRKPQYLYETIFIYFKDNVRRCLEFYFVWVFVYFKLFVSEQGDLDKITKTNMLSWAFADHIWHKYQQAIYERPWYQLKWGTVQVDSMLGSELHKHRSALRVACGFGVQFAKIYDTEKKCNSPF